MDYAIQIKFSFPEQNQIYDLILSPGINVLVGINNVGKSRILKTIHQKLEKFQFDNGVFYIKCKKDEIIQEFDYHFDSNGSPAAIYSEQFNSKPDERQVWTLKKTPTNVYLYSFEIQNKNGQIISKANPLNYSDFNIGLFQNQNQNHKGKFNELYDFCAKNVILISPQRNIVTNVSADSTEIPVGDGSNLAKSIFHHSTRRNEKFDELEKTVAQIFPEIDKVMTISQPNATVTLSVHDKFANKDIELKDCGTGVGQVLLIVAVVLFNAPGKIIMIDEPHAFLHPQAERELAEFLLNHLEHSYVIATHSPVLINALKPNNIYAVKRDKNGTSVKSVLNDIESKYDLINSLGFNLSDFAWADRILFVEGESDSYALPILFERWGWSEYKYICPVIPIYGASNSKIIASILQDLKKHIKLPYRVLLDGDQNTDSKVEFLRLPELDFELIMIRDIEAVRKAFIDENPYLNYLKEDEKEKVINQFNHDYFSNYLKKDKYSKEKGKKILTDLMYEIEMSLSYENENKGINGYKNKIHLPIMAKHIKSEYIEDIKNIIDLFVTRGK